MMRRAVYEGRHRSSVDSIARVHEASEHPGLTSKNPSASGFA